MARRTSRKPKRSSRKRTSRRNGYGRSYGGDPRWMSARFDGIDDEGNKVRKGDEVLYWPSTKRVQTGEKAKAAWRRFLSEKGDDEGTPFASNPRRRKRVSRRNATFDQTYYVRMDPEDVWSTYHLPVTQEMVLHAPRTMKVSERMTLPEARKVARWYLSDPAQPYDRLEIARFAGTGWVGKSFVSMLEEQWARRPKKGGGFTVSQYQGAAGYKKLRKNGDLGEGRDRRTGQYAHTLEAMCTCGHELGLHAAATVGGKRPCFAGESGHESCDCEKFKKVRAKKSKAT